MGVVGNFFRKSKLDALLLHNGDITKGCDPNFAYFAGKEIDSAYLILFPHKQPLLFVSKMNVALAKKMFPHVAVEYRKGVALAKALRRALRGCRRIGVNKGCMSAALFEALRRKTRRRFVDASKHLAEIRAVKSERELAAIKKATRIVKRAIAMLKIREGVSERQLASQLQANIHLLGAEPSFKPVVLSGRNTAFPHASPGARRVRRGNIVLVDAGARWQGYCSDVTRCFFVGKGKREEIEVYRKLKGIFRKCLLLARVGVRAARVAKFADDALRKEGLGGLPHALGHGVGREVHELPNFRLRSKDVLRRGMAFTLEPAWYGKEFGARYEETVVMKGKRASVL